MALRELLLPWDAQPQEAAALRADKRPTLIDVWCPGISTGTLIRGYQSFIVDSSNVSIVTGPAGIATLTNGTRPARYQIADSTNDLFPVGATTATIAIVRRHLDTTLRNGQSFGGDSGATARVLLHAPFGNGNVQWDFGNATNGSGRVTAAWGGKTTNVETLVVVAGPTKGREVWRNRTRLVSNTSATASVPTISAPFNIGSANSGSDNDVEECYLFVADAREWSDAEIIRFASQPWAEIFEPRRIPVPVAVGGGGSWSVSLTETASASDAQSQTVSASVAAAETAAAVDTSSAAAVLAVSLQELISAIDNSSASFSGVGAASILESGSSFDTISATAILSAALSELATATDLSAGAPAGPAAASETASAIDVVSATAVLLRDVQEATTATEMAVATKLLVQLLAAQCSVSASLDADPYVPPPPIPVELEMPAATMTYTSLMEDATNYLEMSDNSGVVEQLPRLLTLAENKLATKVKTLGIQHVVNSTLIAGQPNFTKPSFWRNSVSFTVQLSSGETKTLTLRSVEFCRNVYPNASVQGEPRYYADYNYDNFLIVPTPSEALPLQLIYYPRLTPLSEQQQINWMTEYAPQALLAALMVECYLFVKNSEKTAMWKQIFDEAVSDLTREDDARRADRSTVIS